MDLDAAARLAETPAVAALPGGGEAVSQQVALARQSLLALASLQAEMQAHGDTCQILALEALLAFFLESTFLTSIA